MTQDLEHLKKLVFGGGFDEESKDQVRNLEHRLHVLSITEKLTEHPVIAEYLVYLKDEITRCKELLSEDDKLTERQQDKLFEKIKQCREFIQRFDPSQKQELHKTIKDLLHAAQSS